PKATDQSLEESLNAPQATAPGPAAEPASHGGTPSVSQTTPAGAVVAADIACSRTVSEAYRGATARKCVGWRVEPVSDLHCMEITPFDGTWRGHGALHCHMYDGYRGKLTFRPRRSIPAC